MKKIVKYIKNPKKIILFLMNKGHFKWLSDKKYLKLKYQLTMKKKLNLDNPQTFNEKLQWLKLYDKNPEYVKMVDKYEAKKYVANIIGYEYIIPTLGIWNDFEEIDFENLPNQFVLKPTHTSGDIFICKDKSKINYKILKKQVNKWLKKNYYYVHREWPYKNVKPRIIAEQYMEDESGELMDYKIYAFNGKCDYVMVCFDRMKNETKFFYYNDKWELQKDFSKDGKKYGDEIKIHKPIHLDKMFSLAKDLSKNIPFVRVDFYEVKEKIFFGELTFFPSAGFDNERTEEVEIYLDKALKI